MLNIINNLRAKLILIKKMQNDTLIYCKILKCID